MLLLYKAGRISKSPQSSLVYFHRASQSPRGHMVSVQITQTCSSLNHIKPVAFYLIGQRCKSGLFTENSKDLAEDVASRGDNPCSLGKLYRIYLSAFSLFFFSWRGLSSLLAVLRSHIPKELVDSRSPISISL